MKLCSFIFLFFFISILNQIVAENAASSDDKNSDKSISRSKRSFLDYVTIGDLNWLHKILEMVFEYFTKQYPHPPHVNLPYPHIFTTPKSRRPTTTETPASSTENIISPPSYHHKNVYERLSAQILKSNEKITEMPGFSSPAKAYFHTKTPINSTSSSSRTCDTCQAGKQCFVKLQSFNTEDPIFQYAYSHGTPLTDILDSVLRETQALSVPPPLTWKATATPETVQLTTSLMNLYKPNRSLVVGVFTGLAVIGIASVTDSRGIVIGLEYPEYSHFWERVGMKIATRAGISNRIQIRSVESIDKALTKLAAYEPNAFDFIFMNE
uniref:Uncharacterized protein n=1 Tax=Panagrolaimus sp. PS1159 TaxID=55785 RepID=A0AC35G5F7_9BILA